MSSLIGFTGKMGSGKSTAIECLSLLQTNKIVNVKFAAPLYDMQEYIYRRIQTVYKRNSAFIKDRKLLQFLGTEWGRDSISSTLWIDIWKCEVQYLDENYPSTIVVCDDVRYDNEAAAIKAMGGSIIQVVSDKNNERININEGFGGHRSEEGIDLKYVDFIIENNGTVDDLKNSLLTFNAMKAVW